MAALSGGSVNNVPRRRRRRRIRFGAPSDFGFGFCGRRELKEQTEEGGKRTYRSECEERKQKHSSNRKEGKGEKNEQSYRDALKGGPQIV